MSGSGDCWGCSSTAFARWSAVVAAAAAAGVPSDLDLLWDVAAELRACSSELKLTPCANARVCERVRRTGASTTCCSTGSGRFLGLMLRASKGGIAYVRLAACNKTTTALSQSEQYDINIPP
jgi:hypothetical protein